MYSTFCPPSRSCPRSRRFAATTLFLWVLAFVVWVGGLSPVRAAGAGASSRAAGSASARHGLGTVAAWGDNRFGQTSVPAGLTNVVAVAGGFYHSLALKSDGTVVAWGDNGDGEASVPAGLTGVVAIAGGGSHSLALRSNGTVVAWGDNSYGQLNIPAGLSNVVAIAAGFSYSLALQSNGTLVTGWGDNSYGQTNVPAGLSNAVAVAAGFYHSLALKSDGTVSAWGDNVYGQASVPAGLTGVVAVAGGGSHSLALRSDGTVVAWGYNGDGETSVPAGLKGAVAVAAGFYHSLALKSDGTVVAWGYNGDGETSVPAGLTGVVAIAGGGSHSLALRSNGTVVAWGYNGSGQTSVPAGLANVAAIAAGGYHSLALVPPLLDVLTAQGVNFTATANTAFTGQVAAFTDTRTDTLAAAFTASISWGDGSTATAGTVTGSNGAFGVSGTHTYAAPGSYTVTTTITGPGGPVTAASTATVIGTPTANPQSVSVPFNTAKPITLTGSDPNSPPLALTYTVTANPTHGTLSGTAPSLTYTPTAGYHGTDSFTFRVNNGFSSSAPATVSLTVAAGTPTANPQSLSVAFNTAKALTLSGSDPDVPALPLTYAVLTAPAHGTLSGAAPNLTYTPTAGYQGADSFTFRVSNGTNTSSTATVNITVTAGTPTASGQSVSVAFNTAKAITLTGSDPDVPALPLAYTVATGPAHGTLTGTAPSLTYTPAAGYYGPDSFTFTVSNGTNASSAATVSLTIAQGAASDVTAQITLTRGGFRYVRATGHYLQPVTLANNGAALADPVSLVLDGLAGAALVGASGTTSAAAPSGSPYVTLPTGGLAAGASVTVTLEFTAQPSGYTLRVLAGPGAR